MIDFVMPPTGFGPGSQPLGEDDTLEYMQMPQDMRTYSPHTPEVEDPNAVTAALAILSQVGDACARVASGGPAQTIDLKGLNETNRKMIADTLGEGEVAIKMHGIPAIAAQESWFAGVWLMSGQGVDEICVALMPPLAHERAHMAQRAAEGPGIALIPGLANGPAILTELFDKSATWQPGDEAHVINLTLLPHSEPDLDWWDRAFGQGAVTLLSRGYGNCRITATATNNLWRVQFFNSMDTLILDTFEVTTMPSVAIAAPIDLDDSAKRMVDVLETIQ